MIGMNNSNNLFLFRLIASIISYEVDIIAS